MTYQNNNTSIVEIVHFSQKGEAPKVLKVEKSPEGKIFLSVNEGKEATYRRISLLLSEQEVALIALKLQKSL